MSTPTNDPTGLPPFEQYAAGSKVQATYHPATETTAYRHAICADCAFVTHGDTALPAAESHDRETGHTIAVYSDSQWTERHADEQAAGNDRSLWPYVADDDRVYRDAGTGEYVTREYAEAHPDTTVSEPRATGDDRG